MKIKKIFAIGLMAVIALSLIACGNKDNDTTTEEDTVAIGEEKETDSSNKETDYSKEERYYHLRLIKMSSAEETQGDIPKYQLSPGESRHFSTSVYSIIIPDPDENGRIYSDEQDESVESLEDLGMKIEWSTTDGEMDGIDFNGDAEIESESPLSATITFPSEGNYRVRAVLLDKNGKHLDEEFYKDDLIVEATE